MIVTVSEHEISKTVVSDQNRFTITVFGCELTVLRIQNHHTLRIPGYMQLLSQTEHACRMEYILQKDEDIATVDFYENDVGFDTYRYCDCGDKLTIGGHVEDDIYIQDHAIPPHAITILPKENAIHCTCDALYCNEKRIHDSTIDVTALYAILQLRFAICNDMIIFNGAEGIYCVNEPYVHHAVTLAQRKPVCFTSQLHKPLPSFTISVHIKDERTTPQVAEDNILLMTLPSILMAAGALASALLMRIDDADATLLDYLPSMIMPLIMLVSAMVFMPLQRIMRKRRFRRGEEDNKKAYEKVLNEQEETIVAQKRDIVEQLSLLYVMPEILIAKMKEGILSCFNLYDGQFLSLRLGIAPLPFVFQDRSDGVMDERHKVFDEHIRQKEEGPFVLSIEKGMGYLFISHDTHVFEEIPAKLALTHRPDDLVFVFLKNEDMPVYCTMLPHAEYGGKTMIMRPGEYNKACMHMDYAHIVIAYHSLPEDLCMDYAPVFVCGETMQEDQRYAVICDLDSGFYENRKEHVYCHFLKDTMTMPFMDIAMQLAVQHIQTESENSPSFFSVHDIIDTRDLAIETYWTNSHGNIFLQAVCGEDQDGQRIVIDLDETKDGPHGLVAGMTGSGKSEFLIALLLDIAVHNSPLDVSFVIFDFKGGGMLQALMAEGKPLPHIAGTLTNLDGYEVERVLYALKETCRKRQELFMGMHEVTNENISHIDDYRRVWKKDMGFPVLSHLLIVIDEFAELKKEQPQFMDELISIARIGRSLGIHLLLATQKPAGIISEQIRANMSFTVCLKVKDVQDALEVINDRRPASLMKPGEFYLSSRNAIRYGRAAYPGTKIREETITCYDTKHDVIYSSAGKEERETEREVLMEKILEAAERTNLSAERVYHKLPDNVDTMALHNENAFGILDDYRHGNLIFVKREPILAIWGTDRKERENCRKAIFYTLFDQAEEGNEIYLIDPEDVRYSACTNTCGILTCEERERLMSLDERIRMSGQPITIVVEDVETFLNGHEDNAALLHKWLKNAGNNLQLILFLRVSGDLRYRDLACISQRAIIKGTNVQEAAAILETTVQAAVLKRGMVMKWDGYASEVVLPDITETMEEALIQQKTGPKAFSLWKIPEVIPFETKDGLLLLGIDKTNGEKVFVKDLPPFITESEETRAMLSMIYGTEVKLGIEPMMNEEPVLYAGYCSSFSLPYQLHVKEDIKDGEGLYVQDGKMVHLILCNRSR